MTTVFRWLAQNNEFRQQYARAREAQAEAHADIVVDIADRDRDPAKARLRIDTRKWVASKQAPKKYGEKSTTELAGADGGPIQVEERSSDDIARRLLFLLTRPKTSVGGVQ